MNYTSITALHLLNQKQTCSIGFWGECCSSGVRYESSRIPLQRHRQCNKGRQTKNIETMICEPKHKEDEGLSHRNIKDKSNRSRENRHFWEASPTEGPLGVQGRSWKTVWLVDEVRMRGQGWSKEVSSSGDLAFSCA